MHKIPFDQNTKTELNEQEIAELKKQYKAVFLIEVEDKKCYLHAPDRKVLDAAASSSKKAESKFNEVILKGCWLAGDKEIVNDDDYFLSASSQLGELIQFKEASLKKL
jgi:hypothetical protein